jgi:hypothetical protein
MRHVLLLLTFSCVVACSCKIQEVSDKNVVEIHIIIKKAKFLKLIDIMFTFKSKIDKYHFLSKKRKPYSPFLEKQRFIGII